MLLKDKNPTEVVVLRSAPDQIAFGVRSDCVRSLIRFRTVPDQIPYGAKEMCCGFRAQKKGMTSAIPYYDWIKSSNMSVFLLYL